MSVTKNNFSIKSYKLVLPKHLNDNNTLFGGIAVQWIDEIAYITARQYTLQNMVTVYIEKVKFIHTIKCGDIVEIVSKIVDCSTMKLKIEVFIYIVNNNEKLKAITSLLHFAAIDKDNKAEIIF